MKTNRIISFAEAAAPEKADELAAAIGETFDALAEAIGTVGDATETASSQVKSLHAMFDALAAAYRELDERVRALEGRA